MQWCNQVDRSVILDWCETEGCAVQCYSEVELIAVQCSDIVDWCEVKCTDYTICQ